MTARRVWIVLPDLLSIRVFFDTGIVDGLRERLDDAVHAVFLIPGEEAPAWASRLGDVPWADGAELAASSGAVGERVARRVDDALDGQLGYYPLAIRLNRRHGFHAERMQPGHPNWMLDSDRDGALPHTDVVERAMQRWFFSPRRHVPRRLLETMRAECAALVVSNVQPRSVVPYLAAARRLDAAGGRLRRELGSHRRQGRDLAALRALRRPERRDGGRPAAVPRHRPGPRRRHGLAADRRLPPPRPRTDYEALLRSYGLDPARPLVLVMGNTPTNAPYEGRFVERLLTWWQEGARERFQLLFRPHPRDREWQERFGPARGRAGVHLQEPSFTDLEELTVLLQHADAVVANAGTILLDALVNDRPAVCVLYDEGAPEGESWAAKNVVGKHYEELAASGAFYRAESFDEVVAGLERALADPAELADARRRVVREVVGEVDGRAAERVVDAIVEVVGSTV